MQLIDKYRGDWRRVVELAQREVSAPPLNELSPYSRVVAPHRFAEALGAICLLAAAALYFAGAELAAQVLTLMVVALALLNAAAGICVGCQMYLLLKRFSGKGATA